MAGTPAPDELLAWHAGLISLDRHEPSVVGAVGLHGEAGGLAAAVAEVLEALDAVGRQLEDGADVPRRTAFAASEVALLLRHFASSAAEADARVALQGAWDVDRAWNAALAP